MANIYPLYGTVQHYAWGGKDYIPQLFHIQPTENHYAEWWLGAHALNPSLVEIDNKTVPLTEFLAQHPNVLGQKSLANFGEELPYLLKILDVAQPLSIQLHPTKPQAEIGFVEENKKGIALTDPKRTYKDKNHKPEMMIALSDFWLLHGFRPKAEIIATLAKRPSLVNLAEALQTQDLHSFYAAIMQADQAQLATWLNPIIEANKTAYEKQELTLDNPDYWVLYTIEAMNIPQDKLDAGLICFYLFNLVHLKKGEGIFQDAGIPHAYLRGQNIELMACSDNVIRGGLTPKHIDIPELLKVIDCREVIPQIIAKADESQDVLTYATPASDFALTHLHYQADSVISLHSQSGEILLVMEGEIVLKLGDTELKLKQGESAFICADSHYEIQGKITGYAVIAGLPK